MAPQSLTKMRQFGIGAIRAETSSVKKLWWKGTHMNNDALSIVAVIAIAASAFIFGVEIGRKVEHNSIVSTVALAVSASSYSEGAYYTPAYSSDYTTDYSSDASYTPSK